MMRAKELFTEFWLFEVLGWKPEEMDQLDQLLQKVEYCLSRWDGTLQVITQGYPEHVLAIELVFHGAVFRDENPSGDGICRIGRLLDDPHPIIRTPHRWDDEAMAEEVRESIASLRTIFKA